MIGRRRRIRLLAVMSTAFLIFLTGSAIMGNPADKPVSTSNDAQRACVILLHGMGRSHRSMAAMARHLAHTGYRVVNLDYPSTRASIETLSQGVVSETVKRCRLEHPSAPIHFVTHSLGGILVRHYLQSHRLPPDSRVVMLSPPNQGSEVADLLKEFFSLPMDDGTGGPAAGDRGRFRSQPTQARWMCPWALLPETARWSPGFPPGYRGPMMGRCLWPGPGWRRWLISLWSTRAMALS